MSYIFWIHRNVVGVRALNSYRTYLYIRIKFKSCQIPIINNLNHLKEWVWLKKKFTAKFGMKYLWIYTCFYYVNIVMKSCIYNLFINYTIMGRSEAVIIIYSTWETCSYMVFGLNWSKFSLIIVHIFWQKAFDLWLFRKQVERCEERIKKMKQSKIKRISIYKESGTN